MLDALISRHLLFHHASHIPKRVGNFSSLDCTSSFPSSSFSLIGKVSLKNIPKASLSFLDSPHGHLLQHLHQLDVSCSPRLTLSKPGHLEGDLSFCDINDHLFKERQLCFGKELPSLKGVDNNLYDFYLSKSRPVRYSIEETKYFILDLFLSVWDDVLRPGVWYHFNT